MKKVYDFVCPNPKRFKLVWSITGCVLLSVVLSDSGQMEGCSTVSLTSVIAPLMVGLIASSGLFGLWRKFFHSSLKIWEGFVYTTKPTVSTSEVSQVMVHRTELVVVVVWYLLWQWRGIALLNDMHLLPSRCTVLMPCECTSPWSYFTTLIAIGIIGFIVTYIAATVVGEFFRKLFEF